MKEKVFHMAEMASKGLSNTIKLLAMNKEEVCLSFEKEIYACTFYEYINLLNIKSAKPDKCTVVFSVKEFKAETAVSFEEKLAKVKRIVSIHSEIFTLFPSVFLSYSLNPDLENGKVLYAYKITEYEEKIVEILNSTLLHEFKISAFYKGEVVEVTYPEEIFFHKLDLVKKAMQKIDWGIPFFSIHHAAIAGNIPGIRLYFDKGVHVDELSYHNETPLYYAVANRNVETIEFLLTNGASINALTDKGEALLYFAAFHGYTAIIEHFLLKKEKGETSLFEQESFIHFLAKMKTHVDSIKVALKHGIDINLRDSRDNTPLHCSIMHRQTETSLFLIEQSADIEAEDSNGITPLILASSLENTQVIHSLIKKGVNINRQRTDRNAKGLAPQAFVGEKNNLFIKYYSGDNALHWGAIQGNLEVVKILMSNGADVNIKDSENNTALHHAAARGHNQTVSYLLDNGARMDVKGSLGMTPLEIALNNGHKNTALIFSEKYIKWIVNLILKDQNECTSLETIGEKIVLEFRDEQISKLVLPYLKFLIHTPLKSQRNVISLPISALNKIDVSNVEEKILDISNVLQRHDEIFCLFPVLFQSYYLNSVTPGESVVYSYAISSTRYDYVIQKINQALRRFGISAFCNKSLFYVKFPIDILLSEKLVELKKVILGIAWHAPAAISISPVSSTSFHKTIRDEEERAAELARRENEREKEEERKRELAFQEIFSECRLKTQCDVDSLSDWSEIEEALQSPATHLDIPRSNIDCRINEPDEREGGVQLIRDPIDEKGKEEDVPSEKKKEKKKPKRKKMSLVELEKFVSTSSGSSIVTETPKPYTQGFRLHREKPLSMHELDFKCSAPIYMRSKKT